MWKRLHYNFKWRDNVQKYSHYVWLNISFLTPATAFPLLLVLFRHLWKIGIKILHSKVKTKIPPGCPFFWLHSPFGPLWIFQSPARWHCLTPIMSCILLHSLIRFQSWKSQEVKSTCSPPQLSSSQQPQPAISSALPAVKKYRNLNHFRKRLFYTFTAQPPFLVKRKASLFALSSEKHSRSNTFLANYIHTR